MVPDLFFQTSGMENEVPLGPSETLLKSLVKNLSCLLTTPALDIIHSGIEIYDSFSISEVPSLKKPVKIEYKPIQAISLRSKSTRNLNIRENSLSSLLKSFKFSAEKPSDEASETIHIEVEKIRSFERSNSRQKISFVDDKRRNRSSHESKRKRNILKDANNMKSIKYYKITSKDGPSRKGKIKSQKYVSLTPNKY